jgi:ABC-type transporter Mla subunit MlaD
VSQLNQQIQTLDPELKKYKTAWTQVAEVEKKARAVLKENPALKSKISDLNLLMEEEKKRNTNLEELLNKERREKRAALTCLHTTESKLNQATFELDAMKKRYEQTPDEDQFNLSF